MNTKLLETISSLEKRIENLEKSERLRCEMEAAKLEAEIEITKAEMKAQERLYNAFSGFPLPPNVNIKLL